MTDPSNLAEPKAKKIKKKEKHLVKEDLLDSLKEGSEIASAESIEDSITKEEIPITYETIASSKYYYMVIISLHQNIILQCYDIASSKYYYIVMISLHQNIL